MKRASARGSGGIFHSNSFFSAKYCALLSKPLQKSISNALTEQPLSSADCHVCIIDVSACAVECQLKLPNWKSSNVGNKLFINHHRTNPSNTLAKTGSKDIGHKSVSTGRGGFILGRGTTSADFHNFGKHPCLRDELYTAAMGSLKNGPHSFSNHVGNLSCPADL